MYVFVEWERHFQSTAEGPVFHAPIFTQLEALGDSYGEFMILQNPVLGVYYVLTSSAPSAPYSAAYEFIVCFPNVMFLVILFTFSNAYVFT